jgi:hypothetical protein
MKLYRRIGLAAFTGLVLTAVFFTVLPDSRADGTNTVVSSSTPIPYPLDYCVVSGDKLGGDMGPPVTFIYSNSVVNQEIKFCCADCKPDFLKHPDKYMKIIKAAEAKQKKQAAKN